MEVRSTENTVLRGKAEESLRRLVEDDAVVVAAAKSRCGDSFELLVERHERRIFLLALRITRNVQDAEDVTQQSFQKAFTHLETFKGESCFATWLTRIAINEALLLLRQSRRSREMSVEETTKNTDGETCLEVVDSRLNPETSYLEQERKGLLYFALEELTPSVRRAIQLRELEERSTRETAQILGISFVAAKSRVFHGKRKLREVFGRCSRTRMASRGGCAIARVSNVQEECRPSDPLADDLHGVGRRIGSLRGVR